MGVWLDVRRHVGICDDVDVAAEVYLRSPLARLVGGRRDEHPGYHNVGVVERKLS